VLTALNKPPALQGSVLSPLTEELGSCGTARLAGCMQRIVSLPCQASAICMHLSIVFWNPAQCDDTCITWVLGSHSTAMQAKPIANKMTKFYQILNSSSNFSIDLAQASWDRTAGTCKPYESCCRRLRKRSDFDIAKLLQTDLPVTISSK
jgi:hypothetical protein